MITPVPFASPPEGLDPVDGCPGKKVRDPTQGRQEGGDQGHFYQSPLFPQ